MLPRDLREVVSVSALYRDIFSEDASGCLWEDVSGFLQAGLMSLTSRAQKFSAQRGHCNETHGHHIYTRQNVRLWCELFSPVHVTGT